MVSLEVNPDSLLDGGQLGLCSSNSLDQLARDVNPYCAIRTAWRRWAILPEAMPCKRTVSETWKGYAGCWSNVQPA